ncbi:MAG TPA: hypothetical protein VIJ31_04310 [Acidothermaceae bacterium]
MSSHPIGFRGWRRATTTPTATNMVVGIKIGPAPPALSSMTDAISDAAPIATAIAPSTAALVGDASRSRRARAGLPIGLGPPHPQLSLPAAARATGDEQHRPQPFRDRYAHYRLATGFATWFATCPGRVKRVSTAGPPPTMMRAW